MAINVYSWTQQSGVSAVSFDAWVASQGTTQRSLSIGTDVTITGNLTLPSTIDLVTFTNGAKFQGTGKTLTINKMSALPKHQVFAAGLNVVFATGAVNLVFPEWFGSGNGNILIGNGVKTPLSKIYVEGGVAIGTNLTAGSGNLYVSGSGAFTGVVHGATPTVNTHLTTKLYVDTASGALDTRITNSGIYAANISGQLSTRINNSGAYSANVSGQMDTRINATGLYAANTSGQLNTYITNTSGQLNTRLLATASGNHNHGLGTSGNIVKYISPSGFGDSIISESGNLVTIPAIKLTTGAVSGYILTSDDNGSGIWKEHIQLNAGVYSAPTVTATASGTVLISTGIYNIYSDNNFNVPLIRTSLPSGQYSLTNNSLNYVLVSGNPPSIVVRTERSGINQSNCIPISTIYRTDNTLHVLNWDELAKGLPNKLADRLVRTERFAVETGGLVLGEASGRYITVTSGVVWFGGANISLAQLNSSGNNTELYYHTSSGTWTSSGVTQYNNTQYDSLTGLQTLTGTTPSNSRYTINWIYRGIDTASEIFIVLGTGDYTLDQASAAIVPSTPDIITAHCVLLGKIIVQKSATSAYSIMSAFTTTFAAVPITDHNNLYNLQGGIPGEYYHLTATQASGAALTHTITSGYLLKANSPSGVVNSRIRESGNYIFSSGIVVFPKASGNGIMVDTTNPTYGWRDILGDLSIGVAGAHSPAWTNYSGKFWAYSFDNATGPGEDQLVVNYHMPHDYKLDTMVYPHVHWQPTTTATGTVVWEFQYTAAKGHQQQQYSQFANIYVTGVIPAGSGMVGKHYITEANIGSGIPFTNLEPDSLIVMCISRIGSGTYTDNVIANYADLHYQSTNMPTKQKAPNFYV